MKWRKKNPIFLFPGWTNTALFRLRKNKKTGSFALLTAFGTS
jgi:hypothetical protein